MTRLQFFPTLLSAAAFTLLTACSDPAALRWETATHGGVFTLSIDPAGAYAVVGTVHEGGSLWRLADGVRVYDFNHRALDDSALVASAFSPDGRFVVTAERNSIAMWDVASGQASGLWTTEGEVQSLALSDGGRHVLVGMRNHSAMLIDVARNTPGPLIRHASTVNAVGISRDGTTAATGADDGTITIWNMRDGSEILARKFDSGISVIAFSPDETRVFVGRHHGKGALMDLRSGQDLAEIGHDRSSIVSARFTADGVSLLTGFPSGRILLWDLNDGKTIKQWVAKRPVFWHPTGLVATDVAFSRASGQVMSGFSDGSIVAWQP